MDLSDNYKYNMLKAQLSVLKDVDREYHNSTVPNAIQQIESRIKCIEEQYGNKDE